MKLKQKIGAGALTALLVLVGAGIGAVCMLGNHVTPVVAGEEDAAAAAEAGQAEYVPTEFRTINGIEYPVNENGLTYGNAIHVDEDKDGEYDTHPDLIAVGDFDGKPGYAYWEDYTSLGESLDGTPLTLEEQLAGEYVKLIPVYEVDGVTYKGQWGYNDAMVEAGLAEPDSDIVETSYGKEPIWDVEN